MKPHPHLLAALRIASMTVRSTSLFCTELHTTLARIHHFSPRLRQRGRFGAFSLPSVARIPSIRLSELFFLSASLRNNAIIDVRLSRWIRAQEGKGSAPTPSTNMPAAFQGRLMIPPWRLFLGVLPCARAGVGSELSPAPGHTSLAV